MLNLLKRKDRYWIRKEYLMRFISVLVLFVAISLIVLLIALFSFYTIVKADISVVKSELNDVKGSIDNQEIDDLLEINKRVDEKISQFDAYQFNQTDIVERVVSIENEIEGVESSLINISIEESEEEVYGRIEVRGVAETRGDLVLYQDTIKENEFFNSIEIPLSSFAKNSDISFSANIRTVDLINYFENYEE